MSTLRDTTPPTAFQRRLAACRQQLATFGKPQRRSTTCGCTDGDACLVHGVPCCWITNELCSGCADTATIVATPQGRSWMLSVLDQVIGLHYMEQELPGYQPCQAERVFQETQLSGKDLSR